MRNGSIWSDVVFEKEVIFHEFDFDTSESDFESRNQASGSFVRQRVFFLPLLSLNFDNKLRLKFHNFFMRLMLRYTIV